MALCDVLCTMHISDGVSSTMHVLCIRCAGMMIVFSQHFFMSYPRFRAGLGVEFHVAQR